jgi:hypothetical protein
MRHQKRTDVREQALGDELMVVDEKTDQVHVLNVTSAFVWKSLDETSDLDQLEQRMRDHFKPPAETDVRGMAGRALAQFEKLNLLLPAAP